MTWRWIFGVVVLHTLVTFCLCRDYESKSVYSSERVPSPTTPPNKDVEGCREKACRCFIGPAGAPGMPGFPGIHGQRGPVGPMGPSGEKGQPGVDGKPGENGAEGPRGRRGHTGETGPQGPPGSPGAAGLPGVPGMTGPKGDKGDSGIGPKSRVAFSASLSKKVNPVDKDTKVSFDRVITNIGDDYDREKSAFVCRKNGTYIFFTHILGLDSQNAFAWIMLNKEHKVPLHGDGRAGYGTGSNTVILNLKATDYVWINLEKSSGLLNDYSTFSGYLVYED